MGIPLRRPYWSRDRASCEAANARDAESVLSVDTLRIQPCLPWVGAIWEWRVVAVSRSNLSLNALIAAFASCGIFDRPDTLRRDRKDLPDLPNLLIGSIARCKFDLPFFPTTSPA